MHLMLWSNKSPATCWIGQGKKKKKQLDWTSGFSCVALRIQLSPSLHYKAFNLRSAPFFVQRCILVEWVCCGLRAPPVCDLSVGFHMWKLLFWQVLEWGIRAGMRVALISRFILCCVPHRPRRVRRTELCELRRDGETLRWCKCGFRAVETLSQVLFHRCMCRCVGFVLSSSTALLEPGYAS